MCDARDMDHDAADLEAETYQKLLTFHQAVLAEANLALSTFLSQNPQPDVNDENATKMFKDGIAPLATAQVTAKFAVTEHQKTNPSAPGNRHRPSARRAKIPGELPKFQPSATTTDLECEEYLSNFESKLRSNNVTPTWLDESGTLHHDWSNALPLALGKTPDAQHLQFITEQLISLPWKQARARFKQHFAVHVELFGLQRRVLECVQGKSVSVATHIDNFRRVLLNAIPRKDASAASVVAAVPLVGYILFRSLLPDIKARILQQGKLADISADWEKSCREYIAAERSLLSEQALTIEETKTSNGKRASKRKRPDSEDNITCARCRRPGHKSSACFATHYQGTSLGMPGKLIGSPAPAAPPARTNKPSNGNRNHNNGSGNSSGKSGKQSNDDRCSVCKSPSHHANSCPTKLRLNNIRIQNMQLPLDTNDVDDDHNQPTLGSAKKKPKLKVTLKKGKPQVVTFCSSCGQTGHAASACLSGYGNGASDSDE